MILCLGMPGAGKTALIKAIQVKCQEEKAAREAKKPDNAKVPPDPSKLLPSEIERAPFTIPTMGTDITTLPAKPKGKKSGAAAASGGPSSREVVTIREIGGAMAPIWSSFVEVGRVLAVMFVLDASSPESVGASAIHLVELLDHAAVRDTLPVLLVFTKTDLKSARTLTEYKGLLRLDQILRTGLNSVLIAHTTFNAVKNENLDVVYEWCMKFATSVPTNEDEELYIMD